LVADIQPLVPRAYLRYFEPFLGGATLFFSLAPKAAVLGDLNRELVDFYRVIRQNCEAVARRLAELRNDRSSYYAWRGFVPRDPLSRAVRFLFLNRTCFNGLYRTNSRGEFNVPFGNNHRPVIADVENLRRAAAALRWATIVCADFERTCADAASGDLVYFDPPYTVAHERNGFLKYNARIFSWTDQTRLRRLVDRLTKHGVAIILTNAAHRSVRELYRGYNIRTVRRLSLLSAASSARRPVKELIVTNY
jgi:DNA adenine methylase